MQAKAGRLGLLIVLLSACGGQARGSGAEASASGTAGTSGVGSVEPTASGGGGASAGTTSIVSAVAGGDNSDAGRAGSAGAPPVMHAARPCTSPVPRPHGGGYLECNDGSLRRASPVACDEALPRAAADMPLAFTECTSDTDCTASPHGYCAYGACKYGCVMDDECPSAQACFCGDFVGTCIPANCRSDADCPADFPCTSYQEPGFATAAALWCQSPQDECITDAQCNSLNPRVSCKVQLDHRVCYTDPIG